MSFEILPECQNSGSTRVFIDHGSSTSSLYRLTHTLTAELMIRRAVPSANVSLLKCASSARISSLSWKGRIILSLSSHLLVKFNMPLFNSVMIDFQRYTTIVKSEIKKHGKTKAILRSASYFIENIPKNPSLQEYFVRKWFTIIKTVIKNQHSKD